MVVCGPVMLGSAHLDVRSRRRPMCPSRDVSVGIYHTTVGQQGSSKTLLLCVTEGWRKTQLADIRILDLDNGIVTWGIVRGAVSIVKINRVPCVL